VFFHKNTWFLVKNGLFLIKIAEFLRKNKGSLVEIRWFLVKNAMIWCKTELFPAGNDTILGIPAPFLGINAPNRDDFTNNAGKIGGGGENQ
jgi:hypothetical protein